MPRGSKKSANQHNNRHENGIVAPGRRIRKQKSNGHLNGGLEKTSLPSTPPSRSPSTAQPRNLPDKSINGSVTTALNGHLDGVSTVELEWKGSYDHSEESRMTPNGLINGFAEQSHRKIDVNAAKTPINHDNGAFNFALTILRSCPLGDTIAILIFLLSLPSTLLTLTNALFAVLTFMPPAGSFLSIPTTFSDVFQGSGGTPSFATIVLTDTLGLVLWLILWSPFQTLILELAQAVVATTLGGGNSSNNGGSDTTLLCMLIVSCTHVARYKWNAKRVFGYEWPATLSSLPSMLRGPPLFDNDTIQARSPAGWFRILIALHILIQGLVHVARRWYTKREYAQSLSSAKKTDPEAVVISRLPSDNMTLTDSKSTEPTISTSELRSKSSISSLKESREKISSGKKKRKQGTFVRGQQPLWAAFAATKVTVLREYEQSHALSETVGSNATDTRNLGSAHFALEEGRVWVTMVHPTSFRFSTSFFHTNNSKLNDLEDSGSSLSAGIDRSKPIYVRINGANWASVKIERLPVGKANQERAEWHWTGEVYGLSPACSFICSFVRSEDDVVIYSINISTPSLPTAEKGIELLEPDVVASPADHVLESSVLVTTSHQSQRPSSPTSPTITLKNSIAALEASIAESHARQKRSKKENKATVAAIKKEIDILNAKISKIGTEDKAHSNRHLQWNQHYRQADEAIASISSEIDAMGSIPEDDLQQWKEKKAKWEESKENEKRTREDLLRCHESVQREKSAIQAEAATTQQKRERLQIRAAKLSDQLDRLQLENTQGLDEKERREAEQVVKAADHQQFEERSKEQIATYQRSIQDTHYHTQQCWQQAQIIENAFHQHHMIGPTGQPGCVTPEGDLPGSHPYPPIPMNGFRFPASTSTEHPATLLTTPLSIRHDTRPRSTSLLSGNSVYTDFSDQDPAPPMPPSRAMEVLRGRQLSGSSGSGSGSIGSQRDMASPVTGMAPRKSPVVKKGSPVWN